MGDWIDFKDLRAKLNFADVLRHYGVEIKAKGNQHHGYCPIPSHNGKKNSPSFSANLDKGIFNCFGCGAKGNVLDFAAMMEGVSIKDGVALRDVAVKLRDKFCSSLGNAQAKTKTAPAKKHIAPQTEMRLDEQPEQNIVVNAPLDFELKGLDPKHSYLDRCGFSAEMIQHFGLGFCSKGLLAGRIAIPIHNPAGTLVGYAGRLVENHFSEEHPKYKFPPKRKRDGVIHEFHKSELLYNSHRLTSPVEHLAIVEGFPSVWWLTQMGCPNVVALMGCVMSEAQARIVASLVPDTGRVWVIPDGDEAGTRCAQSVFEQLSPLRFLKWLKLDADKQPTDYPGGWLRKKIGM